MTDYYQQTYGDARNTAVQNIQDANYQSKLFAAEQARKNAIYNQDPNKIMRTGNQIGNISANLQKQQRRLGYIDASREEFSGDPEDYIAPPQPNKFKKLFGGSKKRKSKKRGRKTMKKRGRKTKRMRV